MAGKLTSVLKIVLPTRRANEKGTGYTNTFNPQQTGQVLSAPAYREHLQDLFNTRQAQDSRSLLRELFKHDPDMSATVNAYLTVANTEPMFVVRDLEGQIDRDGQKTLEQLLLGLTTRSDYSKGFQMRPSLRAICENLRYLLLLRGGIGAEAVFDKQLLLREVRNIDMATIEWFETAPGVYVPRQDPENSGEFIDLNVATFMTAFYRRDPTTIYSYSPFVAAINTVSARTQVINDLYAIMQHVGYPRVHVTVMEEILRKNAPAAAQADENEMRKYINARIAEVQTGLANQTPEQSYVHTDAIVPGIINQGGPSKSLDVSAVIGVLNSLNQAALKTVSTVIGRGESGVNTASVEARIFSLNAQELNHPVAEVLSKVFTLALRMHGLQVYVETHFAPVEMRPETELEPMMITKQQRFMELLSHGIISDDELHMTLFRRVRPDYAPELSGTGFMVSGPKADTDAVSSNSDPQGRAITPSGAKSNRDNKVAKK